MIQTLTRGIGKAIAGPLLAAGIALGSLVIGDVGGASADTTVAGQRAGAQSTHDSGPTGPAVLMPHLGLAG